MRVLALEILKGNLRETKTSTTLILLLNPLSFIRPASLAWLESTLTVALDLNS